MPTQYIIPMSEGESAYQSKNNPLVNRPRIDKANPVDVLCDRINSAIATKLELAERYFQVFIRQDPLFWSSSAEIKRRFRAKGIYLSWRLHRGSIVLYVQVNRKINHE